MIIPALPEERTAPQAERAYLRNLLPRQQTRRSWLQRTLLSDVFFFYLKEVNRKLEQRYNISFLVAGCHKMFPKGGKRYPVTEKQAGGSNRYL
jgi:hypothetical protein